MTGQRHQALGLAAMSVRNAGQSGVKAVGPKAGFTDPDGGGAGENWRHRASCRSEKPSRFFPLSYTGAPALLHIEETRKICARCPVAALCLDAAMRANEPDGIWAGTTPEERTAAKRRLAKARLRSRSGS